MAACALACCVWVHAAGVTSHSTHMWQGVHRMQDVVVSSGGHTATPGCTGRLSALLLPQQARLWGPLCPQVDARALVRVQHTTDS
jgi:hypothetical protein